MLDRSPQRGLTLVETLVALAILGAVASAILVLISQNTRFAAAAEDRMLAGILLDNLMTEELARSAPLERGADERAVDFARRNWIIDRRVSDAGVDHMIRIEMKVRDATGAQTQASAVTLKAEGL